MSAMNIIPPFRILLLAWSLPFFLFTGGLLAAEPHDFSAFGCEFCHSGGEDSASRQGSSLDEDIDTQCVKCHDSCSHGRKHRGSRAASGSMKEELPLDTSGRMACYTCHDPHPSSIGYRKGDLNRYLRMTNLKRELCLNCHRITGQKPVRLKMALPPPA